MSALTDEIRIAVRQEFSDLINSLAVQEQRLKTIPEAAAYLTVSRRTLTGMIANGELPRVRSERRVMVDIQDLDRWIEAHKE